MDKDYSRAFESIKEILYSTPILAIPNFKLLFEVECDARRVGIEVILTQSKRSLAYFSEKLNSLKVNYSTYAK